MTVKVAHEFDDESHDYYLWSMSVSAQARGRGNLYRAKVGTFVRVPDSALPQIVDWSPGADQTITSGSTSFNLSYSIPVGGITLTAGGGVSYPTANGRIHPYVGPVGHIYHVSWMASSGRALRPGEATEARGAVVWQAANNGDPLPTLYSDIQFCGDANRCTVREEG